MLLQKVYDKFRGLDKATCDMQKVLIQAEKHRQDKYAEAMRINTDNEAPMQTITSMCLIFAFISCCIS